MTRARDQGRGAADTPGAHTASLSDVASNARLPLPARTRIVRELRDDLGDLTRRLVAQGVAPEEAGRRAAEVILPAGRALQELEDLALPAYRRLLAGFDARKIRRAERGALGAATLLLVALEGVTLLRAGLLADPSPFLWPVLALGTATLVAVLAKAFQFWVKGAHEHPRRGLTGVAVLAALTLGIACAGTLLDLVALAATVEVTPADAASLSTAWIVRAAALLSTAIILAVTGALGWLALNGWVTWAEQEYAEALELTPPTTRESS